MMSPIKEGHRLPKTDVSPSVRKVTNKGQQTPCSHTQLGSKVHIHVFFGMEPPHVLTFWLLYQLGLSYSFSMMKSSISYCSYLHAASKERCQTN